MTFSLQESQTGTLLTALMAGSLDVALLALPVGIAVAAALALATDRMVYRFYRLRRSDPIIMAIVSVGVMFVMAGLIRFIIGPDDQSFADGARFLITAGEFKRVTGLGEGLVIKQTLFRSLRPLQTR